MVIPFYPGDFLQPRWVDVLACYVMGHHQKHPDFLQPENIFPEIDCTLWKCNGIKGFLDGKEVNCYNSHNTLSIYFDLAVTEIFTKCLKLQI